VFDRVGSLLNSDQQSPLTNLEHRYTFINHGYRKRMFQIGDRRLLIAVEDKK